MWLLTKEWPQQTRILIIKWIRWPSFVTINLVLHPPLSLPNGCMDRVAMVSWVNNMHGVSTMVFHLPETTWLWTLLSAQSATDMALFPWRDQPATLWQVDYLDCFHHGMGSILFLVENTFVLDADLLSLHAMFPPKLPSVDLQNPLGTVMVWCTALFLNKKFTS